MANKGFKDQNAKYLNGYKISPDDVPSNGDVPVYNGLTEEIEWETPPAGEVNWGDITGTIADQIDLQAELDAKVDKIMSIDNEIVKFNGTDGDIQGTGITSDDNANIGTINTVQFNITNTDILPEGRVGWNDTEDALQIGMPGGNVTLAIGQEMFLPRRATNNTGSDLKNGNLVYISGGSGNNFEITLASKDSYHEANSTVAMITEDIDNNAKGYCTTYGIVRGDTLQPIDTSSASVGDKVYLGNNGAFQFTKPEAPDAVVFIGEVMRSHATEGEIYVHVAKEKIEMTRQVTKEPTGFTDPEDVIVTGDSTTRTVTLTGTVNAYFHGQPISEITSGWTSPAHDNTTTSTFILIHDGTSASWVDRGSLPEDIYTNILIATAFYNSTDANWVYERECHGVMQWQSHRELHEVIGTYKSSGGTMADYVLNSTVASERQPSVSTTLMYDEDLPTTNAALASSGNYTNFYLSGASGVTNFVTTATNIVPLSGNNPYYNQFNGGSWQQTLLGNNYHMNVWLVAIPMGADTNSQKLRYIWVQGQAQYTNLVSALVETPNGVNLGELTALTPEFVFLTRVTIRYVGGNWKIVAVNNINGTRFSQSTSPNASYLSSVNTDATLDGTGTVGDPLGIDFTGFNTDDITEGTTKLYNRLPAGGDTGQMLVKTDGTDYNTEWINQPAVNSIFANTGTVTSNENGTYADDDFVFGSPSLDDTGTSTQDKRFAFDKSKAAFSAGEATGTEWDDVNRALYSTRFGRNCKASESYAFSGGNTCNNSGAAAFVYGQVINNSAYRSANIGEGLENSSYGSAVFGIYNTERTEDPDSYVATDTLFVIGNGTSDGSRSDALVIYKNGNAEFSGYIDLNQISAPGTTTDKLYNVSGVAYFNGTKIENNISDANATTLTGGASSDADALHTHNDKADLISTINTQTGTTYTLALSDAGKIVEMNNASANTLTIPTNASVAFPIGTTLTIIQYGAGTTTVSGDTGVTVNGNSAGSVDVSAQYGGLALYKRATDEWIIVNVTTA